MKLGDQVSDIVKMLDSSDRVFFSRWLRNPLRTGAFVPSGPSLARMMAAQVDPTRPGVVIELGGGTGAITSELLDVGIAPDRLLVIEQDEQLHKILNIRYPKIAVVLGDACRLRSHFRRRQVTLINAIVSGLPLLSMSKRRQRIILDESFAHMDGNGVFAQFTYGPGCPVPRTRLTRLGLSAQQAGIAWLNAPPATVWRFTKIPTSLEGQGLM